MKCCKIIYKYSLPFFHSKKDEEVGICDFTAFHLFLFALFYLILDAPRTYVNVSTVFKSVLRIRIGLS
jgi:hypothetical protein